jgi:hypothetical protein
MPQEVHHRTESKKKQYNFIKEEGKETLAEEL